MGNIVWLLVTKKCNDPQILQSVQRLYASLCKRFEERDVVIIQDDRIVFEISTNELSVYLDGHKTEPPKILFSRIGTGNIDLHFHIPMFRQFEKMGTIVINNIDSIELCINKVLHLQYLAQYHIPIATTFSYSGKDFKYLDISPAIQEIKEPFIVKAVKGNQGNKVFLCDSALAFNELGGVLQHNMPYLFQEYIQESHGRDMRIIIVDGKPVFSMIRQSNTPSVRANLSQGGKAEIVTGKYPEAEDLAIRIAYILGLDIAGIDLLFSNTYGYLCCEVNNNPGISKKVYHNLGIEDKIAEMIYRKYTQNERIKSIQPVYPKITSTSKKIWLLTITKEKDIPNLSSIDKIVSCMKQHIPEDDYEVVYDQDIMFKMDTQEGLSIYVKNQKVDPPLMVFTRINTDYMDIYYHGTLLRQLEMMGTMIVNPILPMEACLNKVTQFQLLSGKNIPLPTTLSYGISDIIQTLDDMILERIGEPFIIKMVQGNCGNQVFLSPEKMFFHNLRWVLQHDKPYLFQKYIQESHGRDMRIVVIDKKPVFSMIRSSTNGSLCANLSQGGTAEVVTGKYPEAEAIATHIASVMNLDIVGVDLLFSKEHGFVLCEINQNPGMERDVYRGQGIEDAVVKMLINKLSVINK